MLLAAVWGLTGNRRTAMRAAGYTGLALGVGMVGLALLSFVSGAWRDWSIFLGYVGIILVVSGRAMDQRVAFRDELVKGTVADAMRPPPPVVPADISLVQALDDYFRGTDGRTFPVVDDGRVVGTVSLASARKIGARDPMRPVRDGVRPLSETPVVAPDETLDDALEWLGGHEGLVLRDGTLVGTLAPDDVERWYRRVIEGGADGSDVVVPARPDL